ncbi:hypothetical protein V2J09_015938 [Rumex salicifolius]
MGTCLVCSSHDLLAMACLD